MNDRIAALTLRMDASFADLRSLFASIPYGQTVVSETVRVKRHD